MDNHPLWLSEKAVSQLTGILVSTLQKNRFYRRGIPYSKVGRSVRYAVHDVELFMNSHRITMKKEALNA